MRTLLIAALLHIIPVPQPDHNATPPVTTEDAKAFCLAHDGIWNLYSNADQTASWFECDEPGFDPDQADADSDWEPGLCYSGETEVSCDAVCSYPDPYCEDDEDDGSCNCPE